MGEPAGAGEAPRLDFNCGGSTHIPQSPYSWAAFRSRYSYACGVSCPPHSPGVDPGHIHDAAMMQNISGTPSMDGALRAHSIIFIL